MPSYCLLPPSQEPISLTEMKLWLRLDHDQEDTLLESLIRAARQWVEQYTRRALLSQTWRITHKAPQPNPYRNVTIILPLAPFQNLIQIAQREPHGDLLPLTPDQYHVEPAPDYTEIHVSPPLQRPPFYPFRTHYTLDVQIGYGPTPQDVPAPLIQALRLLITHHFENRGDMSSVPLPQDLLFLLQPYCLRRLS